ncbi:RNA recognition motif domain [Trypanosoma melophagium]|uniref:RNA recognition motif domain n=1 Tax=Trypanosoma melophagium TaxID=715481 RepID=UPI003519F5C1|nr:RNA recognition motif domain [Trypanosoma melophagium]
MEDDLAAEIAKIEAELEADCQLRDKQQLQPQQFTSTGVIPAFGGMPAQQQQALQQQHQHVDHHHQMFPNSQQAGVYPFVQQQQQLQQQHQQQQLQQQQQQVGVSSISNAAAAQAHQFSKDSDGRSIFVGNLPRGENGGPTSTPEELTEFFSDCGQILNCTVLRDRTTGELKGTAYVEFASYTGMGRAIDTKNNANFKGSTIIVC